MSVRAMTWVMFESESTGNDRMVLLVIADEADDDGANAYPSVERIALKARVDRTTTMRALARLEAAGELLVRRPETRGRGRHNRYVVVMGRDPDALAGSLGWPTRPRPETSQNDTIVVSDTSAEPATPQVGDNPGDDGPGAAKKGPETSHQAPEMVAPGATRPQDPLTRARRDEPPGDDRRANPYRPGHRRGLDKPVDVVEAERLAAAEHARAEALDLDAWRRARDAGVETDAEARRQRVAAMRAARAGDDPPATDRTG